MASSARKIDEEPQRARPFLKWAGGKRQLVPRLLDGLPAAPKGRYYEPFVGGGALFFEIHPKLDSWCTRSRISDQNAELATCYQQIRDDVEGVIFHLRDHPYEQAHYYKTRSLDPEKMSPAARAARMIYLNRAGFNGLYRVNAAGKFNVPFGRYVNPTICDEGNLRACRDALQGAAISRGDFEVQVESAEEGDLVYFDPPYDPASASSNFTAYTSGGFSSEDQERLRDCFRRLAEKGVNVMLSNSDTPRTRLLYEGHHVEAVQARRAINSKGGSRGAVGEIIVRSWRTL